MKTMLICGLLFLSSNAFSLKVSASETEVASKTKSCNPYELQKNLFHSLGGVFVATIEKWTDLSSEAVSLPIEKSIYSEITEIRGTKGPRKLFKFHSYYTPGQFKVGDLIIGGDKLGHFLQLGYGMYYAVEWKKDHRFPDIRTPFQRLSEAVVSDYKFIKQTDKVTADDIVTSFAEFQEDTQWGMAATMVKSYGDMAADYSGYLFWSQLTTGENPYFKCEDNRFRKARDFHWEEYITAGWDESNNCSEFHPKIDKMVRAQIEKRGLGQCPVSPKTCADLVESYGPLAKSLLHPLCYEAGRNYLAK